MLSQIRTLGINIIAKIEQKRDMAEGKKKKIKHFIVNKDTGAQVNIIWMTGTSQRKDDS